jgi:hypothetical protein
MWKKKQRIASEIGSMRWEIRRSRKPYNCDCKSHEGPHILSMTLYAANDDWLKHYCMACFKIWGPSKVVKRLTAGK